MRLHRRYALYRRYVSFVSSILSFISSIRLFCKFRLNYIAHFWSVVLVCSYFFRHIFVASSMRLFCRSLMIYIFLFWSVVLMHWYHFWHTSVALQPSLMLDFSEVQQICVKRKKNKHIIFWVSFDTRLSHFSEVQRWTSLMYDKYVSKDIQIHYFFVCFSWLTSVALQRILTLDFAGVLQICFKRYINTSSCVFLLTHICRTSLLHYTTLHFTTTNMFQKIYKYIILCVSFDTHLSHFSEVYR